MTVTERVAYLKGLFEGLDIDAEKNVGKVLKGMLDTMEALAVSVTDLEQQNAELLDELDDVYEELSAIEEDFLESGNEIESDNDVILDSDETLYQVICPTCGEVIYLDQDLLDEGSITCTACGEELEFDLSEIEEPETDSEQ